MSITSTELHRTRPLRSSPLAGPSVVSLGDQQPARPVSAHSPLGSKSKSFQTLSRPSSLYTTPSTYAPPPSWQSPHRRRPSTAPGPARPYSEHDSFNDDDGLGPNLHVRYSSSLLSVSETRPSSISLDPDGPLKNPRPILKHRTSFHSSPSSLSSSVSSTEDVRFSAADKGKEKMDASSPRLSNSHGYTAQTAQTDESWYTFSPYATTPKFSRLGLASAGVVMPVSAKELARSKSSASRTKGQSAGAPSQGLSRTTSSASSSMRGRQSSTITDEHGLLTSNRANQQARARPQPQPLQQQRPQAPAPTSGSASGSPSATSWLNVPPPARTRIGTGGFKATARGTIASATPTDVSASSSRSSTSTSVSTRRTSTTSVSNSVASSSTSLPSSASYQQLPQIKKEEKVKKEKRKSLSLSLGLRSWRSLRVASPSTSALETADKDRDEATMIPLPSPPLAAHFPDSPTSPSFVIAAAVAVVSAPSTESVPISSITNQTPLPIPTRISMSTSPLPSKLISTPARNSISSSTAVPAPSTTLDAAPVHKLKKRKSASAILARVKSWRWGAGAGGRGGRGAGAGGVDGLNVDGASVAVAVDGEDKAEGVNVDAVIPVPALVVGGEDVDPRKAEAAEAEVQSKPEVEVEVVVGSQQQHPSEDDVGAEANILLARQPDVVSAKETTDSSPTPTSTSPSSPSLSPATIFTPMPTQLDTLIPSPNLHVSSDNVPGYIQSQLQLLTQTDTRPSPAVLALVEAMAPALASSLHSSSTPASSPTSTSSLSADVDVAVDEDFVPSSNSDSTLTLVSEQHEQEQDVDGGKVLKNEDRTEALDQVPVQELDKAPQNFVAAIESGVHVVVDDKDESAPISAAEMPTDSVDSVPAVVRTSTSSIPHSTLTVPASAASAPSDPVSVAPAPPTNTPLLPSTSAAATPIPASAQNLASPSISTLRDRSRSQSRTRSLSTTRARSRSVRRIWNSLVCGAADAEQMAIEAWAEVQARQNAAGDLETATTTTMGADTGRGRKRGMARDVKGRNSVRERGGEKGVEMDMDKGDAVVVVAVVSAGLDVPSPMVKVATA